MCDNSHKCFKSVNDLYNLTTIYNCVYHPNLGNLFLRKTQYFASPLLRLMFTFKTDQAHEISISVAPATFRETNLLNATIDSI